MRLSVWSGLVAVAFGCGRPAGVWNGACTPRRRRSVPRGAASYRSKVPLKLLAATTLVSALLAAPGLAAEPCDAPSARELKPLQSAIASDEAVAAALEATADACPPVPLDRCDATRLACGEVLDANLHGQNNVDEGTWVRDMLLPYLGQSYKPIVTLPTAALPATEVSCSANHLTLRAAAQQRRQQADRRKMIATEYARWVEWSSAVRERSNEAWSGEVPHGCVERSNERLRGNLAAHGVGGIASVTDLFQPSIGMSEESFTGFALGGDVRFRHGIWAPAPADGMASGVELRAFAQFVSTVGYAGGRLMHFEGGGEARGWLRHAALGVAVSLDWHLSIADFGGNGNWSGGWAELTLGPSLAFAVIDTRDYQLLIGARWAPTVASLPDPSQGASSARAPNNLVRFAGEVELGFSWFSLTLKGSVFQETLEYSYVILHRLNFVIVLGLGGRLRW